MVTCRISLTCLCCINFASASERSLGKHEQQTAVAQELRSPDSAQFCTVDQAEFSTKDAMRTIKLWVDSRNLAGVVVRTHFEVTIDPKSGLVNGATCLECAAEDEKQKLNEAMAELQELTSPTKASPSPAPQ